MVAITTKIIYAGLLGLAVFFAFLDMCISAYLVNSYNNGSYPSNHIRDVTRFTLFVSLWTMIIGGAYIAFSFVLSTSIIASVISNAVFLFITFIFWLASAASTEDAMGGSGSCNDAIYIHCNQLRAMEAFAWINFILFFAAFIYIAFIGFKAAKKGEGYTGPVSA